MPTAQNIQENTQAKTLDTPLVSFVVTAYNIPYKMLRKCIDSIMALSLTHGQREIILVDDGSDEPAIKKIKDVADDIIYIRQRNQGLSAARNIGMRCASGQYIQFVDGDDYLLQAQYEHCLDILRYRQPVDMVMFHSADSNMPKMTSDYDGPMTGAQYMATNNLHAAACGYVFSKSILGSLQFVNGIYHEDEDFTPQIVLRTRHLYTTTAVAYYYRRRSGSITHSHDRAQKDKRLDDLLNIIIHLHDLAQVSGEEEAKKALERRVAQLSMDYLYNVIKLTRSRQRLKEAENALAGYGLYPLPDKRYTLKYRLFRKLV